ncbi:MAG: hypothetical protein A2W25_13185 [candidate division Zixibacteria bacterium RBG_16_53_22]|nr:MAG: hypothetical protein A2W25_13185 [candidate division Zixibacteria bacterium RBG_16_53_22]
MKMVDDLKNGHTDIVKTIDGLNSEELDRPGTIGDWSARDVLLHIAMWDGEALKALAVWRTGHEYDWSYTPDYDKFNAFWIENTRQLSASQVIQMFNLIRHALICDMEAIPDEIYRKRGEPKWIYSASIDHTSHHLNKLMTYRASLGK